MVFFDVLYRVNDLVHELEGDTGNDAFGVGERTLESAEGNTGFLGGDTREELLRKLLSR